MPGVSPVLQNNVGFTSPSPGGTYAAILKRNHSVVVSEQPQNFPELRDEHLRKNLLFEDPLFPAIDSSLFPACEFPFTCEWRRPPQELRWCSRDVEDVKSSAIPFA
ncbi:hypothetical protein SKAU_G00332230 [Synaphobranchus kaupii]|uniref:Uncharacterized protein n=1 Tax=Synaphobranchus kaupii TaxID=118154 RepID=A0A9Q1ELB9_SYNKA|nr:hypothetical protein SKAU_G00332230 [Synaphobranchus kaupii]